MNGSHARFLLKKVDDSFFGVGSRPHLFSGAIDHILVNGAHVEPLIPPEGPRVALRLILDVITVNVTPIVSFLGEVGAWCLFLGVTELQVSGSHCLQ